MTTIRVLRILLVLVSVLATALVTMWSSYAIAGVLTINFPTDLADNTFLVFHDTTADGFRISPKCHYDNVIQVGVAVPGIGWDASGCPPFNSQFPNIPNLGPPPFFSNNGLYIDDNGRPFGLLSLEAFGDIFAVKSSKGGVVIVPSNFSPPPNFNTLPPPLHVDFIGPEWRDILWVAFSGQSGGPDHGFNQLVVLVPTPSTFALLGLGVLILGWRSRSHKPSVDT